MTRNHSNAARQQPETAAEQLVRFPCFGLITYTEVLASGAASRSSGFSCCIKTENEDLVTVSSLLFCALTLFVGQKEGYSTCKNLLLHLGLLEKSSASYEENDTRLQAHTA